MARILKASRMGNCIGCGLCELIASRVAERKLSYSDSFVQIMKVASGEPRFRAAIDHGRKTDYKEVRGNCPGKCFDIAKD